MRTLRTLALLAVLAAPLSAQTPLSDAQLRQRVDAALARAGNANDEIDSVIVRLTTLRTELTRRINAAPTTPPVVPPPTPPPVAGIPQPSGQIRYDTRTGGAQSIQAATSLAAALTASGFYVSPSGTSALTFATDADGTGANAFRFDWRGVGATTEIDLMLYRGMGGLGLNNAGEVWIQWKVWQSRTATGGGIGTAGSWNCCSQGPGSGKRIVWFRGSGNNTGRFTFAPGGSAGRGEYFIDSSYNPTYADVTVNWNNFVSQWITLTFRFKADTSATANDGILEAWFNGTKIKSLTGANLTHFDFTGELQLGGPTWIGVPQDQTMYLKDIVVWQP